MAYVDLNSKLDWASSFQRTGKFPLDRSAMFASYADALAYAKQDGTDSRQLGGTSYVGQIVVVYGPGSDGSTEEVAAYVISAVGSSPSLKKLAETTASGDLAADVAALQGKVGTLEGKVTTLEGKDSPSREEFSTLEGKVTTNTEGLSTANGKISALETKVQGLNGAMHFVGVSTTDPTTSVTIDGKPEYAAASGDVVLFGKKEYVYNGTAWVELGDEGSHLTQSQADTRYVQITTYNEKVGALESKDTELEGKITALEGAGYITGTAADGKYVAKEEGKSLVADDLITKLTNEVEIHGVNEGEFEIGADDKILGIKAVEQSKVTGLTDSLGNINGEISSLKESVGTSADEANEEGTLFARVAKIKQDLAAAGKIDTVKVNGVALEIGEDKSVDIKLATAEAAGVVKSSAEGDKISVAADGTMSINTVSTDKLVQGTKEVVLNGGNA